MIKSNVAFMYAQEILKDLNIDIFSRIDLDCILDWYGIKCKSAVLKKGIDGAFNRSGLNKQILINSTIGNANRKRFTVSHELGHIAMNHPPTICSSNIHRWVDSLPGYEEEANQFATELLLPRKAILIRLKETGITFEAIAKAASHYSVSLYAAARRFLELSKYTMVMLIHDDKAVKWRYFSKGNMFLEIDESGIRSNSIIDSLSEEKTHIKKEIDVEQWADDMEGYRCIQDTIYFKKRKEYMTLLSFEEDN